MKTLARVLVPLCMLWAGGLGCSRQHTSAATTPPTVVGAEQWLHQGRRLAQQGSIGRAEEYLLAAWSEGASAHEVLPLLLPMCLSEGRLRTALEYVQRARRADPRDPQLLQISISLHMALGHSLLARREMETLALLQPQYRQAIHFLGEQFFQLGQPERAQPYLEHYKDTWPDAPDVPWVNHMLTRIAQDRHDAEQLSARALPSSVIQPEGTLPEAGRP